MLVESNDNIVELIKYSSKLHKQHIDSLKTYFNRKKSNTEKWFELIYSILVGTQIKTNKVKYCYDQLLNEYSDFLNPKFLKELDDFTPLKKLIEKTLKVNGYRFYRTKSETIFYAILFFEKYSFNLNDFLNEYCEYKSIRKELMKISGVGYKIASHWLRNLGYYIPVIDIHIKKLLSRFLVIDEKKLNYLVYENIQNEIIKKLDIDNFTFDLSLWYYGKNFCGNHKCRKCRFYSICDNNF